MRRVITNVSSSESATTLTIDGIVFSAGIAEKMDDKTVVGMVISHLTRMQELREEWMKEIAREND